MAKLLPPLEPGATPPTNVPELQAELERLRRRLHEALEEKDRALRLLRRTTTDLSQRVQGRTRQLSSVHQLITKINASLDLYEVASTALAGLQTLVEVEASALALVDSTEEIRFVLAQPVELLSVLTQFRLRKGQGIAGQVIQTGRTYLADESQADLAAVTQMERASGLEIRSILCEPLVVYDRVIGAVQLINKHADAFTETDRAFVETVAGSLSMAVENARMYEEVQTQLKQLERKNAELLQTQAQLVRSAKLASVGELMAGLAHEFNNPLGIILGFSQLIGQRAADEKVRGFAALIERESMRVKKIVGDLLNFARPTAKEVIRVDLRQMLDKALNLVEYQLASNTIQMTRLYSPDPVWAMVDNDQITQVLMNLIQNARQAMPQGGELTLRAWTDGAHSLFSVTDTGVGIPEANLDQIFDPFFTTKPVGQGTGLGLSVSYGIIAQHGGEIHVVSQPGAGSTFTVRFPSTAEK